MNLELQIIGNHVWELKEIVFIVFIKCFYFECFYPNFHFITRFRSVPSYTSGTMSLNFVYMDQKEMSQNFYGKF